MLLDWRMLLNSDRCTLHGSEMRYLSSRPSFSPPVSLSLSLSFSPSLSLSLSLLVSIMHSYFEVLPQQRLLCSALLCSAFLFSVEGICILDENGVCVCVCVCACLCVCVCVRAGEHACARH